MGVHFAEKYATPEPVEDEDHDPDPKAVNALFDNVDSSDDEDEDEEENEDEDEHCDSKVEEVEEEDVRGKELEDLMKCIEHNQDVNLLKMTMTGSDKTAAIELLFEMDGENKLIVVRRSKE